MRGFYTPVPLPRVRHRLTCALCCSSLVAVVVVVTVTKVFEGNADSDKVKHSYLEQPITARFLRFQTVHWNNHPSMRVEIVGCQRKQNSALYSRLSIIYLQEVSRVFTTVLLNVCASVCLAAFLPNSLNRLLKRS